MKSVFPGHYRPTQGDFDKLWREGIIASDASTLLNLHRYPVGTAKEVLEVFAAVADRLWVPHQAALEYQDNWLGVISEQRRIYSSLRKDLTTAKDQLQQAIQQFKRHPILKAEDLLQKIDAFFSDLDSSITEQEKLHPEIPDGQDLLTSNEIREQLTNLLEGKVGPPYSDDRLAKIHSDGKKRYEQEQPPGFADRDKHGIRQFGDFVLWCQLLDKAKESKKDILFITDDQKGDWWWIDFGRTIGPRPELVTEMRVVAGVIFYMYQTSRFLELAPGYLDRTVRAEVVSEVESVGEADRKTLRIAFENFLKKTAEFDKLRQLSKPNRGEWTQ